MSKTNAKPTEIARNGLRIEAGTGASRQPNVQADGAFQKGWFEVQDEGSQIVADLVFARPGEQVLDFCAGAGGKTLALAASMENKGQIHAYDANKHRLKPIFERTKRAGIRNAQIHSPDSDMSDLVGAMDRVVVDAPCTGTGTWRRHPHAKWKLTKEQLEQRLTEQEEALSEAAPFVKVGGYLIYITCSVWQDLFGFDKLQPWSSDMKTVTLTPASTNTDGFYFAVMAKNA